MVSTELGITLLQAQFDTSGPTTAQKIISIGLVVAFFAGLTAAQYRLQFLKLSEEQKRHKSTLQGQIQDKTPESVRVHRSEDSETIREKIETVFGRASSDDVKDETTFTDAARRVVTGWREAKPGIPFRASVALEEGLAIAVLGSMIFVSSEVWRNMFQSSPGYPSFEKILSLASSALETGHSGVMAYPFFDLIWNLSFAYSILMVEWVYQHWIFSSVILIVAGISVWYLDRQVPDDVKSFKILYSPSFTVLGVGFVLIVAWFIGAVFSTAGRLVGEVDLVVTTLDLGLVGSIIGLILSLVFLGVELKFALGELSKAIRGTRSKFGHRAENDTLVPVYVVARNLTTVFIVALAPFVLVYFFVAIAQGRPQIVVSAFLNGTADIQLLVVASALAVVAAFSWAIRDEWESISDISREAWARKRVRLAVFNRGLPFALMLVTYILAWIMGQSFILAIAASLAVGVGVRLFSSIFQRAKYRVKMIESSTVVPDSALIQVYELEDADGRTHFYSRVNGDDLAHNDVEQIIDATEKSVNDLFTEGEISPSVETWHSDHMMQYGIVDPEETREKLVGKVRRDTFGRLKKNDNSMDREELEGKLEKYPTDLWNQKWREWRIYGTDEGRLDHQNGVTYLVT